MAQTATTPVSASGDVLDYIALLKPRVMSLVVFTGFAGLAVAPGDIHPILAAVAVLEEAAGSAGPEGKLPRRIALARVRLLLKRGRWEETYRAGAALAADPDAGALGERAQVLQASACTRTGRREEAVRLLRELSERQPPTAERVHARVMHAIMSGSREPELLRTAPVRAPVRRLDEVRAARHPILSERPARGEDRAGED